jgi:hypothetical protein
MSVALGVGAADGPTTAPVGAGRVLPVRGELADLLPWGGLRRGSTVSVRGSTSLLLTLLAAATGEGCWAAVVGLPHIGVLAAAELGVAVHRLALVPRPGAEVERTVAALLDGVDLVSVAVPVAPHTARRLSARARQRKAVLLPFGAWPGADVELRAEQGRWTGLGAGHGLLVEREVSVHATGRGAAARPKRTTFLMPTAGGGTGPVRQAVRPVLTEVGSEVTADDFAEPVVRPVPVGGNAAVGSVSVGRDVRALPDVGLVGSAVRAVPVERDGVSVPDRATLSDVGVAGTPVGGVAVGGDAAVRSVPVERGVEPESGWMAVLDGGLVESAVGAAPVELEATRACRDSVSDVGPVRPAATAATAGQEGWPVSAALSVSLARSGLVFVVNSSAGSGWSVLVERGSGGVVDEVPEDCACPVRAVSATARDAVLSGSRVVEAGWAGCTR